MASLLTNFRQSAVTDQEFDQVNLQKAKFHGEWNYTIMPTKATK